MHSNLSTFFRTASKPTHVRAAIDFIIMQVSFWHYILAIITRRRAELANLTAKCHNFCPRVNGPISINARLFVDFSRVLDHERNLRRGPIMMFPCRCDIIDDADGSFLDTFMSAIEHFISTDHLSSRQLP